jgi:aminomuconate-semialdehyde/2-hydroxymuconate-6-semialdehyde dehydrogenase
MKQFHNFINGEFVATAKTFENRNPATNAVVGMVHEAGQAEVDTAVAAAQAAPRATGVT